MIKQQSLIPEFVEFIPEKLLLGTIYISERYSTAAHLCCCGCNSRVVTPLNSAKWQLLQSNGRVSLHPSIGNWSLPCQSHYWIKNNQIVWAEAMSPELIQRVKDRDRLDHDQMADALNREQISFGRRLWDSWKKFFSSLLK